MSCEKKKSSKLRSASYVDKKFPNDRLTKAAIDSMKGAAGMPMGIQVSCLPYEDEKLCGIGRQFEQMLKFDKIPLTVVSGVDK